MKSLSNLSSLGGLRGPRTATGPAARFYNFRQVSLGAGGWLMGLSWSNDGTTRVMKGDGAGHRWSVADDKWVPYVTAATMPADVLEPGADVPDGVSGIAVAPTLASRVYMAYSDDVYRSDDGARTWTRVLSGQTPSFANDNFRPFGSRLEVDPRDPDTVYYGSQTAGLWKTGDGGTTWTQTPANVLPFGLLVDTRNAATRGKITTQTLPNGMASGGIQSLAFDMNAPTVNGKTAVLYAFSYGNGLYRSPDGGTTWTLTNPPGIKANAWMRCLSDGSVLLTGFTDPVEIGGIVEVWRYSGGATGTWANVTTAGTIYARSIAEDPSTPGRVCMMNQGGGMSQSTDHGRTWTVMGGKALDSTGDIPWLSWCLDYGPGFMSVAEIKFDPTVPHRLWLAEGISIWYADLPTTAPSASDVVAWHSVGRGIEQLVGNDVIAPPGKRPSFAVWDRGIHRSAAENVYPQTYGPTKAFNSAWHMDWSATDPNYLVATIASHLFPHDPRASGYSLDAGVTWNTFATLPYNSDQGTGLFGFGTVAASKPGNVVWVPCAGKRPHFTKNNGESWQLVVLPGFTDADYALLNRWDYFVRHNMLAADRVLPDTFYLYVWGAPTNPRVGTYRSSDGASNWEKVGGYAGENDYQFNSTLKTVPGRAGHLYLTHGDLGGVTTAGFRRSIDGGQSWQTLPGIKSVSGFGFGASAPGSTYPTICAAGYVNGVYGVYLSPDEGQTWQLMRRYPAGRLQKMRAIDGDKNVYGRFYLNMGGAGFVMSDVASQNLS